MATTATGFRLELYAAFREKVDGRVAAVTKKIALEALSRVILKTPVDTGRARANWQTQLRVRPDGVIEAADPSGASAISEGAREIGQLKPYDTVYIANNLPYISALNSGHSKQAPQGMVEVTIAELQAFFGNISAHEQL